MKNTKEITATPTAAQIVEAFKRYVFSKANVRIRFEDYGDPFDPQTLVNWKADINKVRRQTRELKKLWGWFKNYPVELIARGLIETASSSNTGFRFNRYAHGIIYWEYCVSWYGSIEIRERASKFLYQAYQNLNADDCKLVRMPNDEHALWLTYHFALKTENA